MLKKIHYKVIQSQVISASSCECNWSAHWHIHTKICNRLDPATTEKLVYIYSNSKLVTSTRDADKLLGTVRVDRVRPEAPRRRDAESFISGNFRREARGARRGSAPRRASANHAEVRPSKSAAPRCLSPWWNFWPLLLPGCSWSRLTSQD